MALAALLLVHPASRAIINPSILTATAAIAALERTLGGTVQAALRFVTGAMVGAGISACVVAVLPPSLIVATLATFLVSFAVSWVDITVKSRRFMVSVPVVALAQWWEQADRHDMHGPSSPSMTPRAVLDIALGVLLGSAAAVVCTLVPMPAIPTATRDAAARLKLLVQHVRCAAASLTVIFTHESTAARQQSQSTSAAIPLPRMDEAVAVHVEALRAVSGERFPLLRSDVVDRTQAAKEQVVLLAPLPDLISWEPAQWLTTVYRRHGRKCRSAWGASSVSGLPSHIHALSAPLQPRLRTWSALHVRLMRVLQSLAAAEQAIASSWIADLFAHHLSDPLSAMCEAGLHYYALGVECGTHIGSTAPQCQLAELAAARHKLDACVAAFFNAYAATRRNAFLARLRLGRHDTQYPHSFSGLTSPGRPSPSPGPITSPSPFSTARTATLLPCSSHVSVSRLSHAPQASALYVHAHHPDGGWRKADVLPLHAFVFFSLRFIQVCPTRGPGSSSSSSCAGAPGTGSGSLLACDLGGDRLWRTRKAPGLQ